MKKSSPTSKWLTSGCDSDVSNNIHDETMVISTKLVSIAESFEKKEQSWIVTSQIPTDLTIRVQDMTFYIHKYPLLSRCGYLSRLDLPPSDSTSEYDLKIENFPGGSETFELVLKFCYGLPIDLSSTNVASLRCASEFLEMTEELDEGNLISKSEAFLTFVVLSSWRDSINVLRASEPLSPWAENLQIVRRCCDSVAWKACKDIPRTVEANDDDSSIATAAAAAAATKEWWFDDISTLRIDHFVKIITAIRVKGVKPETVGACIMNYAAKWVAGFGELERERDGCMLGIRKGVQVSILSGRNREDTGFHNKEQRMIIESLVSILPPQREAVSCGFLLWILKMSMVYSATPALVSELEKRIGLVLEDASLDDLLIPNCGNGDAGKVRNFPYRDATMHDVDVVQRIVEFFLMQEQQQQQQPQQQQSCRKIEVGRLLDAYLAEIARDPNLSVSKFQVLAEALPQTARSCDDGLYRAIDTYLKEHPSVTEHERRRLCKAMDCQKLSLDACTHASQNERLPLRIVVQVLFMEQVKMRAAIQGKEQILNENFAEQENWSSTKKEIKSMRSEIDKLKGTIAEMQTQYSELQREFERQGKQKTVSGWSSGWKKIKSSAIFHAKMHAAATQEMGELHHTQTHLGCSKSGGRRRASIS